MASSLIIDPAGRLPSTELFGDTSKTLSDVIRLYQAGLSVQKVAARVGWSNSRVWAHLHRAGVTRTSGEGVHLARRAPSFAPVEALIELVDGLLLGDASIEAVRFTGRLSIGQSGAHMPWVHTLHDQLAAFGVVSSLHVRDGGEAIIKGQRCTRKPRLSLRTASYPWFLEQRRRWYPNGAKVVPTDVRLTPTAIAGWLCGDGVCAGKGYRVEFCTDDFPEANVRWLVGELQHRLGWTPTISDRNRIVLCRQADRDLLLSAIRPHVPACFQHKLELKERSPTFKVTDSVRAELIRLRGMGWSFGRLAKHVSMSKSGVHGALRTS